MDFLDEEPKPLKITYRGRSGISLDGRVTQIVIKDRPLKDIWTKFVNSIADIVELGGYNRIVFDAVVREHEELEEAKQILSELEPEKIFMRQLIVKTKTNYNDSIIDKVFWTRCFSWMQYGNSPSLPAELTEGLLNMEYLEIHKRVSNMGEISGFQGVGLVIHNCQQCGIRLNFLENVVEQWFESAEYQVQFFGALNLRPVPPEVEARLLRGARKEYVHPKEMKLRRTNVNRRLQREVTVARIRSSDGREAAIYQRGTSYVFVDQPTAIRENYVWNLFRKRHVSVLNQ